ncbi:MAG: hypothetical protein PWP58_670 [Bacillota bacterium]|nr:hypothetical protein [Bacillota bacterium]
MFILIVALFCALLVAVFALQNSVPVTVTFLAWRLEMSLVLIILGAAVLGAVAVFLLGSMTLLRQRHQLREAGRKIKKLEDELSKQATSLPSQQKEQPAESLIGERNSVE